MAHEKRFRQVCDECGSEAVNCDAYATWNVETQEWELSSTFDKGSTCDDCGGECRIDQVREMTGEEKLVVSQKYWFLLEDDSVVYGRISHMTVTRVTVQTNVHGEEEEHMIDPYTCKVVAVYE